MLLNNLSVSNGCQVSFVSDVAPAKTFPRSESDGGDDDDGDNDDNKKCDDVNTIEIEDGDRVPGDEGEGSEKVRKEAEERKNKDDESSEGNLDGGSMVRIQRALLYVCIYIYTGRITRWSYSAMFEWRRRPRAVSRRGTYLPVGSRVL